MHKVGAAVAAVAAAFGLVAVLGNAGAAATAKKRTFHTTTLGAHISTHGNLFESASKITGDVYGGTAAALDIGKVSAVPPNSSSSAFPLTGSSTTTGYYRNGTIKTKSTFKLFAPNAQGISVIKGSGNCVSGTGAYKHGTCKFTFNGTFDLKTTITKLKTTGTTTQSP